MTSFRKIAVSVTCVAVICGVAILWLVYKQKTNERKLAEEARAFRVSAEQGDPKAQDGLGVSYSRGRGVPQDYTEAVRWFRQAADQGYAKAQSNLASLYYYGKGVPQDYAEALRWYRKAADQGDGKAQYGLGFSYGQGKGVPQDYAEAARWFRQAAGQGDANAQYALGSMYREGHGVPQDYAEAARWYRKAAGQGDAKAERALGLMRREGRGVAPARWATIAVSLLLALLVVAVPERRWGRATWVPSVLTSALFAAILVHELLSVSSKGLFGTPYEARVLVVAVLAGGSAIYALLAVGEALRGSKRGGEHGQPSTPP